MIPDFTSNTYLPPGIYTVSVEEFEERFVHGAKRKEIFKGLQNLIKDLKEIGCTAIYIDGSYVSSKERPGDVDVCWDLLDDPDWEAFAKNTHPVLFMTKGKRFEQQTKYNADIFPANLIEGSSGLMFLDFFQKIKYTKESKGIIKIELI